MHVIWSNRAFDDLDRLYAFLARKNPRAAQVVRTKLWEASQRLMLQPHMGQLVETLPETGVRRLLIGEYELRYVVVGVELRIIRAFHTSEDR